MAELSFVDSLLEQFDVALSQHQRLLRLQVPAAGDLLPHRLVGKEALGATFRYRLDCLSQQGDIELKSLMAQEATLSIMLPDGRYRDLHGLVEEAVMLGEDGGVYYYQLTLVPWFAMLKLGRDSRIFQNLNVIDIATQVFQGHAVSKGRFRFDTRRDYPERSYCVQYRESDFNFVSRLFEEEGLFYYFEHTAGQHTLVITDDVDTCSPVSPQQIRFHRQDATETEDTVTQWRGVRRLQPKRVTVGSFDYKQPPLDKRTTLDTQDDQGNLPETELYDYAGEYYYREFERGERLVDNRLEAHESRAKRFYGAGGIRHLSTGAWFELTQHSRHDTGGGEEREFLILGLTIHAENSLPMTAQLKPMPGSLQDEIQAAKQAHGLTQEDPNSEADEAQAEAYRTGGTGHFLIDFEAQRRTHAFRNPLRHPRPVVSGPQTAIIVGPEGEEVYSDHLNRVKAHFHWDRLGQRNDHDSCWLRVAQNNAGTQWGGVFTPRIGQEVLVDFLEGDVDRPLITGRIYNGEQTPEWHSNGLFSGFKSKTYRGGLFNELVLDDATDQERIKLNSEQKKTQLNLGYLIHQQGNFRGAFRGTGFDLRTDAYGSVRANKGLYLTSFGQPEAAGEQLELDPVKTQLDAAYELKDGLSNSATAHNAEALTAKDNLKTASEHTNPTYGRSGGGGDQTSAQGATDGGGKGKVKGLAAPWLHLASPAGITFSTPESLHFAQTHDFSATTGQDMNFSQGKSWVAAAREKLSLFVEKAGIKLFAGKQKVEIQAQSDNLELTSKQDNTTTSTESKIDLAAAEEVLLVSGGAYVRIKGGNIELHAPGKVEFFGAMKSFTGPAQQAYELPTLPDTEKTQLLLHHTYGNDEPVALAQYKATFPDGSTRTGQLDSQGKATLDGVPPGCAFVDYHTQPDPINPDGSCFPKDKEGPPDISMLAQRDTPAPEPEPETTSETEPEYTFGEEATKVLSDKWDGFTGSVATGVAALPFVGDDASRAQARADVWQGVKDQYNGIRALSGPNILDLGESAIGLVTGDPEKAAAASEQWNETKNAWSNVADNAIDSWNEAEQRNGTLGALEMSTFAIGSEFLGGKGTGAVSTAGRVGHAAEDAAGAARRASTPSFAGDFKAGKSRNWSKELNNPTPNSIYRIDGNTFQVDELGRTSLVDIPQLRLNTSARNSYQQVVAGRADRLDTDVGGHLLGSQFGGPGEGINIVAMDRALNSNSRTLGQFGQLETKWANKIRAGDSVGVKISPVYEGTSLRPARFDITETINGEETFYRLLNKPGG
ncbi:hypothetical protein BFW38_05715 [Terasakiispira papahanaumokuakeensis]|uniref:Type IV secretion protein Rhs n=1 Tax=Terasakiispira papahanaumokuakeensis TaxID=197479 RepID=A0A1E2V803_9GAMM|nr:type VI secretion system tip protein TssI/VgrG [Terasakiispira papahanaumokuakeensis]ODC03117.1 hypothetical protein BFW38_05715 [Terasakiispira papahanaumokuakeensis]